ncbi:hypothetical protein EDE05_101178 [Neorhizobium sp. R1-B]|jgi:hypothetical protein|nr:hypothetical protein EDE09_101431 [Neorhizobium sp. S3-V5DH]TDX88867.1 hypothetical protein EDE05_101178 [Neorhizobium sp. R1-B]
MVYEWDARRARRAYLAKMGISLLVILAALAVPAWFAVSMAS